MISKKHFSLFFFLSLFLFILLLYYPSLNIFFFSDDFFWIQQYLNKGILDIKNNFEDDFFLPFSHILQILEINIFGINPTLIHLLNYAILLLSGYFIYKNLIILFSHFSFENKNSIAIYSSLFFIVSPYNTEVINWFTAQSYMFSSLFFLISFYFYIKFKISQKSNFLIVSLIILLLSFLSKEISVFNILFFFGFEFLIFKNELKNKIKVCIYLILPFIIYFTLRVWLLKGFIGGYGVSTHMNFSLSLLFHNFVSYNAKFLLLYRYLFPVLKNFVNDPDFITNATIVIFIFSLFIIFYIFKIKQYSFKTPIIKISIFTYILFIISLIPVINLETSFLQNIQSDRYGYFPSIIFFTFLVIGIHLIFHNLIKHIIIIFILIVFSFFTYNTNITWKHANEISESFSNQIVNNINKGENNILILNIPDNYDGVYLFRNSLTDCIKLKLNNESNYNIKFLAFQNLSSKVKNTTTVEVKSNIITFQTDSINIIMRLNKDTIVNNKLHINQFTFENKSTYSLIVNEKCEYSIFYYDGEKLKKI
ncbi:MAG: hypothetical protein A2033_16685 [Bacteroidetes bacterium GWA2_31_9]|nr:MAG: hypothetical protein A2033_16685 [Bacteroidetes bacterium GWA2_31_9]